MVGLWIVMIAAQAPPPGVDACRDLGKLSSVRGGPGDDRIYGGQTPYRLYGDQDRDFIIGSEGGEVHGGEDADVMIGYGGSDRFVYNGDRDSLPDRKGRWSATTGDTIVDFRQSDGDRIDIRQLGRTGRNPAAPYRWSGLRPRSYSVWMTYRGGDTIISVDHTGDARGDVVVRLLGTLPLSSGDFCGVQPAASRS